jgi:hypothetical protein
VTHALPAIAIAIVALLVTACADATPTPSPATATPTLTVIPPPPTATPTPVIERTPEAQALRLRAEAFALARTEARFDDTYLFNTPAFQEICGPDPWFFGLIGEASFTRAWNNLDDDAFLRWTVFLVEATGTTGTTLVNVATKDRDGGERGLDLISYNWDLIDGQWWLADPPEEACVL